MSKRVLTIIPGIVLILSAAMGILGAREGGAASSFTVCPPHTPCTPIRHVVFVVKENRSFDSMFGTYPHAHGATTFTNAQGQVLPLTHQLSSVGDICHSYGCYEKASDGGKMDQFSLELNAIQNGVDEADSQLYQSDIPNYWTYAQDFVLADNFFSSIAGPSFPNKLFTIGGTDNNVISSPAITAPSEAWGCDGPSTSRVQTMDANGKTGSVFPCFDNPTLADTLDQNGITWKSYAPGYGQPGYYWNSFDAIKHIRFGADWTNNVLPFTQFTTDAAAGNLPAVSWLAQPGNYSDHPGNGTICNGENWTVSVINSIMSNPTEWASTAIVVVWDDYGGLYDHVLPPKGPNAYIEFGPRIPALIISPYAKPGYIDHTQYTLSSMLKFVEDLWGVPPLPGGIDGKSYDLFNSFNFSQQPLAPVTLPTRTCPPSSVDPLVDKVD